MSIAPGTRLDSIATLEDLHGRCVIDEETGCWHMRTARGKPLPRNQPYRVWAFGHGFTTPTRLAWLLSHPGQQFRKGHVAFRKCCSYDCVAPDHISAASRQNWGLHLAASGKARTPEKVAAARAQALLLPHVKVTPELRQWLLESTQSGVDVAHALGIGNSRVSRIRVDHRKAEEARPASSVFDLAMRCVASKTKREGAEA